MIASTAKGQFQPLSQLMGPAGDVDEEDIAQIVGDTVVLIGVYFTCRQLAATRRTLEISQSNVDISRQGQITERFTRAIDQLGRDKLEIRLGGIYALERIARESDMDYWPIMEVLTARSGARAAQ